MAPIENNPADLGSIIPIILRYLVIILLYFFIFLNKNVSMMYVEYIILCVINFVSVFLFYKDMFSIKNIQVSVFANGQSTSPGNEMNFFTKIFIMIIFLTLLLNVATSGIIIAVFEYGRKRIKNSDNYVLDPKNTELLMNIKKSLQFYAIFISVFALFVAYSHTNGVIKIVIQNIVGIIFSVFTIASSVYACILSVTFLENKKNKRDIYIPRKLIS